MHYFDKQNLYGWASNQTEGLGIIHNISLYHDNVEIILDFHVFEV
jgi:hypothetical protein